MFSRYCKTKVVTALKDTPVVIISGPRQSGKTTLAKQMISENSTYITLDDLNAYGAASLDPMGFIRNLGTDLIIIDEVQRVPELFLAIKQSIDENRKPGRYLLTGSSNAMMLPNLADSLAGRIEVINLLPLSDCEINARESTFLDKLLAGSVPETNSIRVKQQLIEKVINGGFPEPFIRTDLIRKRAWHQQYINSIIQKDLCDLANIEHIEIMPKLVKLLANHVGQLLNYTEIANKLEISRQTVVTYLKLLEQLYIFEKLSAWHKNDNKRLVKTPKIHIVDSGLLCAIKGFSTQSLADNLNLFGNVLENYVVNEIKRIATWHNEIFDFSYYRDKDKNEVDLILETYDDKLIAIEIKASTTISESDFKGLKKLQLSAGKQFQIGIVLHDGDHTLNHGEKLYSVPIGSLWN